MIFTGRVLLRRQQQVLLCTAENVFLFDLPAKHQTPSTAGQRIGCDENNIRRRRWKKKWNNGREQKSQRSISLATVAVFCTHGLSTTILPLSLSLTNTFSVSPLSPLSHTCVRRISLSLCIYIYYIVLLRAVSIILLSWRWRRKMSPFVRYGAYIILLARPRPLPITHDLSPLPRLMNLRMGHRWKKSK